MWNKIRCNCQSYILKLTEKTYLLIRDPSIFFYSCKVYLLLFFSLKMFHVIFIMKRIFFYNVVRASHRVRC